VSRSCLVMGVRTVIIVHTGATAHMASCKAVAAVEPGAGGSGSVCVLVLAAVLTAEGCWFEGAYGGTLHLEGPAATATLARCTLVRSGGMRPLAVSVSNGAAAVLRGCLVSVGPCSATDGCICGVVLVGGGASLVLEDGTRVDETRQLLVKAMVKVGGAGSLLAVRGGCSITGGQRHMIILIAEGARAVLDGSTVAGSGAMCVGAAGPGTSLAVRGCTIALGGAAGSSGEAGLGHPALYLTGGAKATVTATRVEGGRVEVRGNGSSLVHSGLACSWGVEAGDGGTARELPARAAVGGGGGQGGGCAPQTAVGPSTAPGPSGGEQATAAGIGGASGMGASAGSSGTAEAEAAAGGVGASTEAAAVRPRRLGAHGVLQPLEAAVVAAAGPPGGSGEGASMGGDGAEEAEAAVGGEKVAAVAAGLAALSVSGTGTGATG
jgi:hypothetical protein